MGVITADCLLDLKLLGTVRGAPFKMSYNDRAPSAAKIEVPAEFIVISSLQASPLLIEGSEVIQALTDSLMYLAADNIMASMQVH
jgi:hypothetical protein